MPWDFQPERDHTAVSCGNRFRSGFLPVVQQGDGEPQPAPFLVETGRNENAPLSKSGMMRQLFRAYGETASIQTVCQMPVVLV